MITKLVSQKDGLKMLKYGVFTTIFMILCALETSFWPNLVPVIPAPQFWLLFIFYISVRWTEKWNLFYIYFLGYIVTTFSLLPLKMALFTLIVVYFMIYFFKSRIHTTSTVTFSLLTVAMSIIYSLTYLSFSFLLEKNPTSILLVNRLISVGMNFLMCVPMYIFLEFLNEIFSVIDETEAEVTL